MVIAASILDTLLRWSLLHSSFAHCRCTWHILCHCVVICFHITGYRCLSPWWLHSAVNLSGNILNTLIRTAADTTIAIPIKPNYTILLSVSNNNAGCWGWVKGETFNIIIKTLSLCTAWQQWDAQWWTLLVKMSIDEAQKPNLQS